MTNIKLLTLCLLPMLAARLPTASADVASWQIGEFPDELQQLVTTIVIENLPSEYEDRRRWGQTKQVVRGLSVRRDGWRIKTKRKRKQVNHGTWTMYRITPIDPRRNVQVSIHDVRDLGDGRVTLRLDLASKLHAFARLSRWNRGIQVISLSTDAEAQVRIELSIELSMEMDQGNLPPDILLRPNVMAATIQLDDYQLQRISKIDGKLADELGNGLRGVLRQQIDRKQRSLPAKINRQIAKNQDKLRFSLHDLAAQRWRTWTDQRPAALNSVGSEPPSLPDGSTDEFQPPQGSGAALTP